MTRNSNVAAVVVTYHPEVVQLQSLLEALLPQVGAIFVVDNTDTYEAEWPSRLFHDIPAVQIIRNRENLGVAAAQNIGISTALSGGFEYILISDQDSMPSHKMVEELRRAFDSVVLQNRKVAAIGPCYVDEYTGAFVPFQTLDTLRCFHRSPRVQLKGSPVQVLTMISSGTLLSCAAVRDIGLMMDGLFIDHVDTEWCFRARSMGYALFGAPHARLSHRLGERSFWVWAGVWRKHTEYGPRRLYYRYRNFVILCKLPYVGTCWKVRAGWNWLGDAYAQLVFSRGRLAKLAAIIRGVSDGLRGRQGPLPDNS